MQAVPPIETPSSPGPEYDVELVRAQFPILGRNVHGHPLVYLDNAATTQKPLRVLDALDRYYREENANVHRGVHFLSELATRSYEGARVRAQRFLNARHSHEIVFVRGATEAINLVAQTLGRQRVREGDEVLVTGMEHHSNLVPWQMLCREKDAHLRVVPISDTGEIALEEYERLLTSRTRLVAFTHMSNALGTVNPVREMTALARERKIPVLIDGAQAAAHQRVDVRELDCDFYVFSGHKLYGPTGIGVLYGRESLLNEMPPYQFGGEMIRSVSFDETEYNDLPFKFEAGTPNVAGAVGLGAALEFVEGLGLETIGAHERALVDYAAERLEAIEGVRLIGPAGDRSSILSFTFADVHPHDVATILDQEGIAVRAGNHCAQPLIEGLGLPATVRASFACYNTRAEVDALVDALEAVREVFG